MMGIIILTGIAFIMSVILVTLDIILNKRKTHAEKILEYLPGYNCGACGFGSCIGMAKMLTKDKEAYHKCRILKGESLQKLEEYLNKEVKK